MLLDLHNLWSTHRGRERSYGAPSFRNRSGGRKVSTQPLPLTHRLINGVSSVRLPLSPLPMVQSLLCREEHTLMVAAVFSTRFPHTRQLFPLSYQIAPFHGYINKPPSARHALLVDLFPAKPKKTTSRESTRTRCGSTPGSRGTRAARVNQLSATPISPPPSPTLNTY